MVIVFKIYVDNFVIKTVIIARLAFKKKDFFLNIVKDIIEFVKVCFFYKVFYYFNGYFFRVKDILLN